MVRWISIKDSAVEGLEYTREMTKENLGGKESKRMESEMGQSREFEGGRG